MSKITKKDFPDVPLSDKAISTHYYLYEVAYQEQKAISSGFFMNATKAFSHALQNHYCITLIECPFAFNFDALLNHFDWCCNFMFFNFSETTIRFDILKKVRERSISREETLMLLEILERHPEPYVYSLNEYEGETKFALMKRERMDENGILNEFLLHDQNFRAVLGEALKDLHGIGKNEKMTPVDTPRKYEASVYGYFRFSHELTFEKQEQVIGFLYQILKELFRVDYSLLDFRRLFNDEQSKPVELDIYKPNTYHLDAQKLHLLFRKLKERILIASWEIIRQKIVVYNQAGELVGSVYQISRAKISSDKVRQVNKILQPVLTLLPDMP